MIIGFRRTKLNQQEDPACFNSGHDRNDDEEVLCQCCQFERMNVEIMTELNGLKMEGKERNHPWSLK